MTKKDFIAAASLLRVKRSVADSVGQGPSRAMDWSVLGGLSGRPIDYLSRFFDDEELNAIEDAFEAGQWSEKRLKNNKDTPTFRLTTIMKNIIKNKGKFTLEYGQPW